MEITIFKAITTEDVLVELETEAKSYEGLYVDMENKPERKYVKDKAALISGMLKKLDRARIDEAKLYKVKVETEADSIKQRLEAANLPFSALIDEHKKKRAEELAEGKRIEDLKALAIQIEQDHEAAIMEEKVRKFEKAEAEKNAKDMIEADRIETERLANEKAGKAAQEKIDNAEKEKQAAIDREKLAKFNSDHAEALLIESEKQVKINSDLAEINRIETAKQAKIDSDIAVENARLEEVERQRVEADKVKAEQDAREANTKHKGAINRSIVAVLVEKGISEAHAKLVVRLAANKQLPNTTINY